MVGVPSSFALLGRFAIGAWVLLLCQHKPPFPQIDIIGAVSASVNLPLQHKVQKFSSGTGSPRWSRKKGRKIGCHDGGG